jgi:hypothetical protein
VEALKMLRDIGAEVDLGKKIAKIPEHIVKEAVTELMVSLSICEYL